MSRPRIVQLGLNGLGPGWEETYRPALERLAGRVTVAALHHSGEREGREAAQAINAAWCPGIRELLQTPDLQGIILTGTNWYGLFPVNVAIESGRSVYVVLPRELDRDALAAIHAQARQSGVFVMPELRLRYMPATLRLRELIATDLGPVQSVTVASRSSELPDIDRVETHLCDWSRVVVGSPVRSVESHPVTTGSGDWRETTLHHGTSGGEPVQVMLKLPDSSATGKTGSSARPDEWPLEYSLTCRHGEVRIDDAAHLRWRSGGQEHTESLVADRSAVAVAIDLFARRLAGGLIPAPDLGDLLNALRVQTLIARSRGGEGRLTVG